MATISDDPAIRRKPCVEVLDEEMARVLSAKTGAERLAIAAGMSRSARRMITGHLQAAHPDWETNRVQREVARRLSNGTG